MKKITFLMFSLLTFVFASAQFNTMAIVGNGAGGWPGEPGDPGPVDVHQMTTTDGGVTWTYQNLVTYVGSVKFRANNSWDNNWGAPTTGSGFPTATAVFNSNTNIPTTGGVYNVTFNTSTLVYTFTSSNLYPVISLVGPAVGGWEVDVDMSTIDGIHYTSDALTMLAGGVKWRQDHAWSPTGNWGASAFPAGTATLDSQSAVDVPAGIYNVLFNLNTLEYSFNYPTIALVGSATPDGWPSGAPGEIDQHVMSTTDGINYMLNSIDLVNGQAKFRQNNNWTVQWGGSPDGFPTGTGSQGGTDINVVAGTYSVSLNRETGAYTFGAPVMGTEGFASATFSVYPNPAQSNWNIMSDETIRGIQVFDVSGKQVLAVAPNAETVNVDASGLAAGIYFAKVATATTTKTIKVVKN